MIAQRMSADVQPRVDPLITELVGLVRTSEKDVQPSVATALGAVCASAGKNIGAPAKASIVELVEEAFAEGRNGGSPSTRYRTLTDP